MDFILFCPAVYIYLSAKFSSNRIPSKKLSESSITNDKLIDSVFCFLFLILSSSSQLPHPKGFFQTINGLTIKHLRTQLFSGLTPNPLKNKTKILYSPDKSF